MPVVQHVPLPTHTGLVVSNCPVAQVNAVVVRVNMTILNTNTEIRGMLVMLKSFIYVYHKYFD